MKSSFFFLILFSVVAFGDVYKEELNATKCVRLKGQDFMTYIKKSLGDQSLDVVYDEAGTCGKSGYLITKATRKRWAAFPTETGCQCYLKTQKALAKEAAK